MDTKEEIDLILSKVSEQAHEMAEQIEPDLLSAEEIVIAAMEIVTNTPINTVQYTSPLGKVDRARATFIIDLDFEEYESLEFPFFGEEYYEEN